MVPPLCQLSAAAVATNEQVAFSLIAYEHGGDFVVFLSMPGIARPLQVTVTPRDRVSRPRELLKAHTGGMIMIIHAT